MRMNRREFGVGLLAGVAAASWRTAAALDVRGVRLGVQTYSFHSVLQGGMPAVNQILASMKRLDIRICELFAQDLMPFPMPEWSWKQWQPKSAAAGAHKTAAKSPADERAEAEAVREWRTNTPASYFQQVAARFRAAGVEIYCYNYSFTPDMTDAEIDAGFRHAKALGAKYITSSSKVSMAKRVVPFAEKHQFPIGWHGHSDIHDPEEISTPETFRKLMAMSKQYRINLDIGHFTAAGFDPVEFIRQNHGSITNLHIKDRKKNDGANMPLGQGDTPIRQVLLLLRDQHYAIPAFLEYEYLGQKSPEEEIAIGLAFERKILES